jgi:flagellar assembly protein FliH
MSITRHQAVGAYRPWEPPAFDAAAEAADPSAAAPAPDAPAVTPPAQAEAPPAIHLPTVAELEYIHDQAHQEGYAAGYEEGTARGRLEALRLSTLAENLEQGLAQLDTAVAEELLALSIEIARLMVRRELAHKPEGIVDIVREALAQLPHGHALIHLHPDDASLVREYLGEQLAHGGNRIVDDDQVSSGGCRIEASGSQIDATLQTRWRRILQNLGCGEAEADWDAGPEG